MLTAVSIFLHLMAMMFCMTFGMLVQEWHGTKSSKTSNHALGVLALTVLFLVAAFTVMSHA